MSPELAALVAGTVLAVGALAFVLYPLFFEVREPVTRPLRRDAEDSPIAALREIEFDRATGKLSENDYRELKATYSAQALSMMRQRETEGSASTAPVDAIEARVAAYLQTHRECGVCGLRPEFDAVYCSNCGLFLDGQCARCKAPVMEPGASFCMTCGLDLSAAV